MNYPLIFWSFIIYVFVGLKTFNMYKCLVEIATDKKLKSEKTCLLMFIFLWPLMLIFIDSEETKEGAE